MMCPKGVARGNQHCPEKEMAMYVTATLIVILQEHLCDRKTIPSDAKTALCERKQRAVLPESWAFSEIHVFTVISAIP